MTELDKTDIGDRYNLLWTDKWAKTYHQYRKTAEKLDLDENTKSQDLLKALQIATKELMELEGEREGFKKENLPELW